MAQISKSVSRPPTKNDPSGDADGSDDADNSSGSLTHSSDHPLFLMEQLTTAIIQAFVCTMSLLLFAAFVKLLRLFRDVRNHVHYTIQTATLTTLLVIYFTLTMSFIMQGSDQNSTIICFTLLKLQVTFTCMLLWILVEVIYFYIAVVQACSEEVLSMSSKYAFLVWGIPNILRYGLIIVYSLMDATLEISQGFFEKHCVWMELDISDILHNSVVLIIVQFTVIFVWTMMVSLLRLAYN